MFGWAGVSFCQMVEQAHSAETVLIFSAETFRSKTFRDVPRSDHNQSFAVGGLWPNIVSELENRCRNISAYQSKRMFGTDVAGLGPWLASEFGYRAKSRAYGSSEEG